MSTLSKKITADPKYNQTITFISNARATSLLLADSTSSSGDPKRVTGIKYVVVKKDAQQKAEDQEIAIEGDAVILATGGYASNFGPGGLLEKYAPKIAHLATTNGPWAQGEGIRMAEAIGAALVDMDQIQIHPTGFVDPKNPEAKSKFLAPEALRASGGILLNERAERFVNELGKRDDVSKAIFEHCDTGKGSFSAICRRRKRALAGYNYRPTI